MSDQDSRARHRHASASRIRQAVRQAIAALATTVLIAWTLGACGAPAGEATVSGTASYAQTAGDAPGTVLIVQIQDVSKADAPATVVGEQRIPDPGSVPVAFAVAYDPAAIDEAHSYVVHARVEDGVGNLLFTTMQPYAVISRGHPTENIQMVLEPVGSAISPGTQPGGQTPAGEAAVSGTVSYAQTAGDAPGTVLIVQIQDVSKADAPATVVGEQRIPDPGPVPVAFAVAYDPAAIDEGHSYVVHARVEDASGTLLFTTMQPYAVISRGHPTENIQMVLEPVGGAISPGTQPGGQTPAGEAAVSGTVSYAQTAGDAPGTVLVVQIQDASKADAPATVVGEQRIPDPGPVPVAFAVAYDPAAIDEGHSYVVHARVEDASGTLLFTTMQQYVVISQGHPTQNVQMVLEMVGSGTPQ